MKRIRNLLLGVLALAVGVLSGCGKGESEPELLNVSYDPTRELWKDLNAAFVEKHEQETGQKVTIKQSHAGSGSQARAVIDGLKADVVTLALWTDVEAIRQKKLIADDWQSRLPHDSLPYYSTIVFVVRKGNPKGIKDWDDLIKDGVGVVTPNPKTSGNGRLSLLAAWAAQKDAKKSDEQAEEFVAEMYRHVKVLDTGARGATVTFSDRKIGDVHLTWENEAHLEVDEADGALEIVYPKVSVKAEPFVALVDRNVDRKKTRELATKYLEFVYTDEAQEILAKHHYRPINDSIRKKHATKLPDLKLLTAKELAGGWPEAHEKFFGKGGVYERVQEALRK